MKLAPLILLLLTTPLHADTAFTLQGEWKASTLPGPRAEADSYWTQTVGDTATFSPGFDNPQRVKVAVYRVVHADKNDPAVRVDITAGGKTETKTLDCSTGETGWVELGTFDFAGQPGEGVKLTKITPAVVTRAAAVRFEALGPTGNVVTTFALDQVTAGPLAKPVVAFDPSKVRPGPPEPAKWAKVFEDEFNGAALDTNVWAIEAGAPRHIRSSRWPENVVAKDGMLRLLTKKESRGGMDWTTAHIWTRTERFQYGYFEARLKIGRARGLNNAFWLMTPNKRTDPVHFEIDMVEAKYPTTGNLAFHNWAGEHWAIGDAWKAPYNLADDFHLYAVEWTDKELIWFIDGQEVFRAPHKVAGASAMLRLSTAVGEFAGPITDALDGTVMEVDYVSVWKRK